MDMIRGAAAGITHAGHRFVVQGDRGTIRGDVDSLDGEYLYVDDGNERGAVRALFDTLVQRSPGSLAVEALRASVTPLPRPIEVILTDAFVAGIVTLHVHPAALVTEPSERPLANALARLQARRLARAEAAKFAS